MQLLVAYDLNGSWEFRMSSETRKLPVWMNRQVKINAKFNVTFVIIFGKKVRLCMVCHNLFL